MEFKDIVSISGMPGLFKMNAQRPNGMIVSGLADNNNRFVSSRNHLFTPLENISIYTETDSVELLDVLIGMHELSGEEKPPPSGASSEEMKTYFEQVLPDYDKDRVYPSDIKKIIRWYNELTEQGILQRERAKREESNKDSDSTEAEPSEQ